jgi:hypothetical protein
MATKWSVILNRIDNALQKAPWKEWRAAVVDSSSGPADAGSIPMLGPNGMLDPSMVPGATPVEYITLTAGANVNAFQAVAIHPDGRAYPADSSTTNDAGHVVGVAVTSATTGNTFTVQQAGSFDNNGWSFTPGSAVFLGYAGALSDTLPMGAAFQQQMGVSMTNSRLLVEVGLPIILS